MANLTDQPTVTSDALTAVLEALDIANAATVGEQCTRDAILVERAGHARVMLQSILGGDTFDPAWSVAYLREQLTKHPAEGYTTWDARMTELGITK